MHLDKTMSQLLVRLVFRFYFVIVGISVGDRNQIHSPGKISRAFITIGTWRVAGGGGAGGGCSVPGITPSGATTQVVSFSLCKDHILALQGCHL